MIVKQYINKDRKNIEIEVHMNEDEYMRQKRRVLYALRKRDEEHVREYKREVAAGVCPICHCLKPLNGRCCE